jgi:ribosomal-protein-alanine N-acetyltransferase
MPRDDQRQPWHVDVPTLSGVTVDVREVLEADATTLFELLSDPPVTEHLSSPPPSAAAFAGFIRWARAQRAAGDGVCFGIVPRGMHDAVGIIQVRALEPSFAAAEWGFAIGAGFWSTGVFIEAANLVAGFSFASLHVNRLEARAVSDNGRGNGVLQKLNARAEANLVRAFRKDGRQQPQLLWSLREEEWRQRPAVAQRFSSAHASRQIISAIAETTRLATGASAPAPRVLPATDYPFFITDHRPSR